MSKFLYVFLVFSYFISVSKAEVDSIISSTHVFWCEDKLIQISDFTNTIGNKRSQLHCDSLGLCWSACIGLFSVLDEPKKKK